MGLRDAGMFLVSAPVQTRHTAESLSELVREMTEIRSTRPPTAEESADSRNRRVMGFPQQFETIGAVAGSLENLVRNDLPLDTWAGFRSLVEGFDAEVLAAVAEAYLDPGRMIWVIVGDWAVIGADLEALGLGPIVVPGRDR